MAKSYRCPNCAASLVFDPDAKKMTCAFCGSAISPDDIISSEATEGFIQGETWDEDATCFLCQNCGAKSVSSANTAASFCAFCGSPTITVTERAGVKPMRIIPFKYGRAEAEKEFLAWCKKIRFLPNSFTSQNQIEKLTGIYVPFWLFDYPVDVNCSFLDVERVETKNGYTVQYVKRQKRGFLLWEKVPLDGSKQIEDHLMECIEPFNYEQLIAFDSKYLSGFYAENYDTPAEDLLRRIFMRVKDFVRGACGEGRMEYNDMSSYSPPSAEYVFLPVWFLNYTYHGKKYSFALNGQTGKVAGDRPISRLKIALFSVGVFLASVLVFGALGFVMFGGIFL